MTSEISSNNKRKRKEVTTISHREHGTSSGQFISSIKYLESVLRQALSTGVKVTYKVVVPRRKT